MPEVKGLKAKDPKVKQPPYPLRSLPANTLHIGPSGSGKSVALIRTLIDRDKLGGCFDAYHVFSPNVWVDSQYKVLGRYIEDHKKVNSYLKKKKKAERLLSIHITIDDFGEQMNVVKSNHSILNTLFAKGRHYQISTALLLQRFRLASPTIRYNAHALYVHKLSNMADLKALAEEFAALLGDEQTFIEIYRRATAEKFGFLYCTLGSDPKFYSSYKSEFRLKDAENRGEEK